MLTSVVVLDPLENNRKHILHAVEILENGGVVALPTETVYGLAADAFNAKAVAEVFSVKQRPSFDPLIVHIHHAKHLDTVASVPEEFAEAVSGLAKEFWPGPLTIVLPKKEVIPDIVTSGLDSVAVRVPSNSIMRSVIKALGKPLAAPSANQFGHISPTSAKAVQSELDGKIPLILDGGACSEGLESTIVKPVFDEKGKVRIAILRSGPITIEQLRKIAPVYKEPKKKKVDDDSTEKKLESPGQLESHYAPRKPFHLWDGESELVLNPKKRYALLCFEGEDSVLIDQYDWDKVAELSPGSGRMAEAAVRLFAVMRQLDEDGEIDAIIAEPVSDKGIGIAMMDRMRRASSPLA